MICSVCQQDNDALTHLCSRCGVRMDRRVPPQLVLESLFTRERIWGITVVSLFFPLMLRAGGVWWRGGQEAGPEARKAPVKVGFPLVFCLMPSLFIFILGPIIVNLIGFLSD